MQSLKDAANAAKQRVCKNAKPVKVQLPRTSKPIRRFIKDKPRTAKDMAETIALPIKKCCLGEWEWPLYIWGPAGVGKTCAGLLTTDWVEFSFYWTLDRLAMLFSDAMLGRLYSKGISPVLMSWEDMVQKISRADLVVIDEIGKGLQHGRASDHQKRVLQTVLDSRERMATLLLGNYDVVEISTIFDPYIASRIQVGTLVSCAKMPDRRVAPE